MATATLPATRVIDRLRTLFADDGGSATDAELLRDFYLRRDEAAFAALVRRHGAMVLGVCRRVTRHAQDAEDAFQATFIVLARKAEALDGCDRLAGWLYGVAYRTALKARGLSARRRGRECPLEDRAGPETAPDGREELLALLDRELQRLPDKYREPLLLCALQGRSRAEAARQLRLPEGTLSSRLAAGRKMLAERLARRGVWPAGAALPLLLTGPASARVSPPLIASATRAATGPAGLVPATVATLTRGALQPMLLTRMQLTAALLGLSLAVAGAGVALSQAGDEKEQPPAAKPADEKARGDEGERKEGKKGDGEERARLARGKVEAVDAAANTIAVKLARDGGPTREVFTVDKDAEIIIEGKPAKLADIKEGYTVTLSVTADEKGVKGISVSNPPVNGFIKSIAEDGKKLILTGGPREGGGEPDMRELAITPDTTVRIGGRAAQLKDIKPGSRARLNVTLDGTTALSVWVFLAEGERPRDGDRPREGDREGGARFRGTSGKIEAVDAAAGTIAVSMQREGQGAVREVYNVDKDTDIFIQGKAAKLADLKEGYPVVLRVGDDKTVKGISVSGPVTFGILKAVAADGKSITLSGGEGERGEERVLAIDPDTKVSAGERPSKLADLPTGRRVRVELSLDGKTVVSVTVYGGDGDRPREGEKRDGDRPREGEKPREGDRPREGEKRDGEK